MAITPHTAEITDRMGNIDHVCILLAYYGGFHNPDGTDDYDTAVALIIRYGITADEMNAHMAEIDNGQWATRTAIIAKQAAAIASTQQGA